MDKYLQTLNESQRQAVLYNDGPSLIIAGAGSGKTRVLTCKIAYLLEQGIPGGRIMALTFTNKAAREMKERIIKVVGLDVARQLWMGTFHSIFSRILRQNAQAIGFRHDFTIYDSADSKNLIKTIIKEMGLDDKVYKPGAVQSQISNAKNHLITPGMYASNSEIQKYDQQSRRPDLGVIYKIYYERCRQSDAMDFDDLLLYTNILFRDHPEILDRYQRYFEFILVDEYQDTNMAQHLIIEMLSKINNKVCVVGDDAQSIYSFRGANIANILNFRKTIPGTRIFKLEQNYRSTKNIVKAADSLIKKNSNQIEKNIFSENSQGEKISVYSSYSDFEEGYLIANRIMAMKEESGGSFSDFAILYRMNFQSRILEEALRKRGIPYRIYGGLSFYQRKEIKDVLAYLRLAVNPDDEEAFKRVINYPARGIGDTTLSKIGAAAVDFGVSYFQVISDPLAYALKINSGTANKIAKFKELIDQFGAESQKLDAFEFANKVIKDTEIRKDLAADNSPEGITRLENVTELLGGVFEFLDGAKEEGREDLTIAAFLAEVSLATDMDKEKDDEETDYVTLMTVHSSKGLEFRNVFISGLEEDIFPSAMAIEEGGLEEERRLLYVAITRAEEHCCLSYAASRYKNGSSQPSSPSRFIDDIDPEYIEMPKSENFRRETMQKAKSYGWEERAQAIFNEQRARKDAVPAAESKKSDARPLSGFRSQNTSQPGKPSASVDGALTVGCHISHSRFGKGEVLAIDGAGDDARATVEFENIGRKQLLLKFAKFDIIEK